MNADVQMNTDVQAASKENARRRKANQNKNHHVKLNRDALAARVSDEEMEVLKALKRTKGVISHIAVANDVITELAMEIERLFRAQRRQKADPTGQSTIASYQKAVEAARIALEAIKKV